MGNQGKQENPKQGKETIEETTSTETAERKQTKKEHTQEQKN